MGAGIAAYLAGPMLLYADKHPAIDVLLMSASVMVLAYLLGRTLDYSDPLPLSLVFVPLILAMPAGAALLHADTTVAGDCRGIDCRRRQRRSSAANALIAESPREALKRNAMRSPAGQARSAAAFRPTCKSWFAAPKTRTISGFLPLTWPGIG